MQCIPEDDTLLIHENPFVFQVSPKLDFACKLEPTAFWSNGTIKVLSRDEVTELLSSSEPGTSDMHADTIALVPVNTRVCNMLCLK